MSKVVDFFNSVFTSAFDILLWPFASLPPVIGLTVISIISGIILLLIFGKISNQKAIKNAKRGIGGSILESILFRHDLGVSLKAQGGMFIGGIKYFLLAVPPIIILMIPCIMILAQLNLRYNHSPLTSGESALITAHLDRSTDLFNLNLTPPEGVVATPPIRDLDNHQITWRLDIKGNPDGVTPTSENLLKISNGSTELALPLYSNYSGYSGANFDKIVAERYTSPLWRFLYPGDNVLLKSGAAINEVVVTYPLQDHIFLGVTTHWILIFLIVSILSGIVASRYFKVEI